MGMEQAVREGKWVNRPKTGYDLVERRARPERDAPTLCGRSSRCEREG